MIGHRARYIQRQRGWSDSCLLTMVLQFVQDAGLEHQLAAELNAAAERELAAVARAAAARSAPPGHQPRVRPADSFSAESLPAPSEAGKRRP